MTSRLYEFVAMMQFLVCFCYVSKTVSDARSQFEKQFLWDVRGYRTADEAACEVSAERLSIMRAENPVSVCCPQLVKKGRNELYLEQFC